MKRSFSRFIIAFLVVVLFTTTVIAIPTQNVYAGSGQQLRINVCRILPITSSCLANEYKVTVIGWNQKDKMATWRSGDWKTSYPGGSFTTNGWWWKGNAYVIVQSRGLDNYYKEFWVRDINGWGGTKDVNNP